MYYIAICDDDVEFAHSLHNLCTEILTPLTPFKISLYYTAEDLYHAFSGGANIDLLILDIKLGEKNGIDLARLLRGRGFDTSIILMSADSSYLLDGYSVQPVFFFSSPFRVKSLKMR